jgi:hypothetical protein
MTCHDCIEGLDHCHEPSIEHADGRTECAAGSACTVPHHLHHWQVCCSVLEPPCPCVPEDAPIVVEPMPLLAAA